MDKLSGLFDPVQSELVKDIWVNNHIRPEIRFYILKRLSDLLGGVKPQSVYIIGSITGYRYSEFSDVDINVAIPEVYITDTLQEKRKALNGIDIPGTKHPLNFFLTRYNPEAEDSWQDASFGVYDIINKKWIVKPDKTLYGRNILDQYSTDIVAAGMARNHFIWMVSRLGKVRDELKSLLKRDYYPGIVQDYRRLSKLYNYRFEVLREWVQQVNEKRHMAYSIGFGIPRVSYQNLSYKILESSLFGKIFEMLKELKESDSFEGNKQLL